MIAWENVRWRRGFRRKMGGGKRSEEPYVEAERKDASLKERKDEATDTDGLFKAVRSLSQMAEKKVFDLLKKVVSDPRATANYCCGGSIVISDGITSSDTPDAEVVKAAPPIDLV